MSDNIVRLHEDETENALEEVFTKLSEGIDKVLILTIGEDGHVRVAHNIDEKADLALAYYNIHQIIQSHLNA